MLDDESKVLVDTNYSLHLSRRGDSFRLSSFRDFGDVSIIDSAENLEDIDERLQREYKGIHPYFAGITVCKTHETVLHFLQNIPEQGVKYAPVNLWHANNLKYPGHSLNIGFGMVKGANHKCPIEKMIAFVAQRIREKNSPHGTFDKIGKFLGRTFHYLNIGTAVPVLGIIPGLLRVDIGILQIIAGIALVIIFAIPSCFSENSEIIVKRSAKHIGYGFCNIFIGSVRGTPIIGTGLYLLENS